MIQIAFVSPFTVCLDDCWHTCIGIWQAGQDGDKFNDLENYSVHTAIRKSKTDLFFFCFVFNGSSEVSKFWGEKS